MAEITISEIGICLDSEAEHMITQYVVDITPVGDDDYDASVLQVDMIKGSRSSPIEKSRIYTNNGRHPPQWLTWWLNAWLETSYAKTTIERIQASHDEFAEQRREAEREARAVAQSYARSVL